MSRLHLHTLGFAAPEVASRAEILRRLVGFDTTSHRSNLGLIHWVADFLAGLGVVGLLAQRRLKRR